MDGIVVMCEVIGEKYNGMHHWFLLAAGWGLAVVIADYGVDGYLLLGHYCFFLKFCQQISTVPSLPPNSSTCHVHLVLSSGPKWCDNLSTPQLLHHLSRHSFLWYLSSGGHIVRFTRWLMSLTLQFCLF